MKRNAIEGGTAMAGTRTLRNRFWVETVLGSAAAILAVVTVFTREWIEVLFGVDPDGGSGALEWAIVAVLAGSAIVFGLLARSELRRAVA